jgi:hypothetical protein
LTCTDGIFGKDSVDTLCALLRTIGAGLGKPVLMTSEGGSAEHPVLGFDPALGKVILFADSTPAGPRRADDRSQP